MFAVIMCGGSGTRFWPLSRKHKPKQFLNITGKDPMVVETCQRLSPMVKDEEMILVLGKEHLGEANDLFQGRKLHILAEPVGRNTAPCMGLGALYARHLGCHGPVAFLPADHFIRDPLVFLNDLEAAGKLASSGGIVTIGIVPSRPETGYGYIRRGGDRLDLGDKVAYNVMDFVEKPDLKTANHYLTDGDYYWNAGIFVSTPDTILKETENQLPELYKGLQRLTDVLGTPQFEEELEDVYNDLPAISFDYGIMEKTQERVFVIPSQCGWSDVGSWASLYELRAEAHDENQNLTEGQTLLIDCEHSFVAGLGGRLVACLGLQNSLVVDTAETLLVADLDRSQDIKMIVDRLKNDGKRKLL